MLQKRQTVRQPLPTFFFSFYYIIYLYLVIEIFPTLLLSLSLIPSLRHLLAQSAESKSTVNDLHALKDGQVSRRLAASPHPAVRSESLFTITQGYNGHLFYTRREMREGEDDDDARGN